MSSAEESVLFAATPAYPLLMLLPAQRASNR